MRPHLPTGGRPQTRTDRSAGPASASGVSPLTRRGSQASVNRQSGVRHHRHRAVVELDAGEDAAVAVWRPCFDRQAVRALAQQVGDLKLVDRFAPPVGAPGDLVSVQVHRVLAIGGDEQARRRLGRRRQFEVAQQYVGRRPARLRAGTVGPDPFRGAGWRRPVDAAPAERARRPAPPERSRPDGRRVSWPPSAAAGQRARAPTGPRTGSGTEAIDEPSSRGEPTAGWFDPRCVTRVGSSVSSAGLVADAVGVVCAIPARYGLDSTAQEGSATDLRADR